MSNANNTNTNANKKKMKISEGKIKNTEEKDERGWGAFFIPIGLFMGMGLGFLIDPDKYLVPFMFIGLGLGFTATLLMGLLCDKDGNLKSKIKMNEKNKNYRRENMMIGRGMIGRRREYD